MSFGLLLLAAAGTLLWLLSKGHFDSSCSACAPKARDASLKDSEDLRSGR